MLDAYLFGVRRYLLLRGMYLQPLTAEQHMNESEFFDKLRVECYGHATAANPEMKAEAIDWAGLWTKIQVYIPLIIKVITVFFPAGAAADKGALVGSGDHDDSGGKA